MLTNKQRHYNGLSGEIGDNAHPSCYIINRLVIEADTACIQGTMLCTVNASKGFWRGLGLLELLRLLLGMLGLEGYYGIKDKIHICKNDISIYYTVTINPLTYAGK